MNTKTSTVYPIIDPLPAAIQHATVKSVRNNIVNIEIAGTPMQAKIAFSCLVQPETGDIVIYSQHETGINYVLGIIERPEKTSMTINFPGETKMQSYSGSLSFMSGKSVNMMAAGKFSCISDQAIHKSREAIVDYQVLTAQGQSLQASFTNIRVFSHLMSTMAKQVIDRFKSYIRLSEVSDQVKAKQMTRDVSGLYSMDSKYTIMVSKKDTKIDGERIHMG